MIRLIADVLDWFLAARCPKCNERHANMAAHVDTNHAGDPD